MLRIVLTLQDGIIYDGSATSLSYWNADMKSLLFSYGEIKSVVLVNEEVTAGTMGLIRYIFNVDSQDITIRKITDLLEGTRLEVLVGNTTI